MSICIIPARGGSKRIHRKNIRDFFGQPIIKYSIDTALQVCEKVIVSTEDPEIASIAAGAGAHIQQRKFAMAADEVGTQEVAKHVLQEMSIKRTERVIVLYPCAPFVSKEHLDRALAAVNRGATFAVSVGANPLRDAGAFYAGRSADFRDMTPLYTDDTRIIVLPHVCDINTEDDLFIAEQMYAEIHQLKRAEAQIDFEDNRSGIPA